MLTQITPCAAPEITRARGGGPSVPVDEEILAALARATEAVPLRYITRAVGDTTHHVHARIETLIAKGLVVRHRAPGAPRRGPGASVYELAGD